MLEAMQARVDKMAFNLGGHVSFDSQLGRQFGRDCTSNLYTQVGTDCVANDGPAGVLRREHSPLLPVVRDARNPFALWIALDRKRPIVVVD